ncbi:MAG: type II toxin-antitoxin system RelE/ParE family toxin [Bacteroidales bacterium]|nr:type II toxin-antitoxin system RelE/ParE family toxin [Bacteroidales bacterium]
MDVSIDDKELRKLYETGKSRKLKLPELVIDKFFAVIQKIESAENIYDFWSNKGLHFEKLKRNVNCYSLRLSGQYRMEIQINWKNKEKNQGEFVLLNISNHYA